MKRVMIDNNYKTVTVNGKQYIVGGDPLVDLESILDGDDVIKVSGENDNPTGVKTLLNESF